MNTPFFGEILTRERISFCVKHSMYKTKFGHRISGSKLSPVGKTAGQAQFDFQFSSGGRKEVLFKNRYSGLRCR